jgi:hypothetical protein
MVFLDRLLPAWRHSDPEVRASAVRQLGQDSLHILASVARNDSDVRIRRIAVKKTDDPDLLLEIGRTDADEGLRSLASARAEDLLVERAMSPRPPEDCLRALGGLTRTSHRVTVATRAVYPNVRRAALSSLSDERSLAEIARRGDDPQIGLEALARITEVTLLHRIAAGDAPPEVALAALARLTDADLLEAIAEDHQAQKGVRKRARTMLAVVLGDDHPLRVATRRERQVQLCVSVERLSDVSDPAAALVTLRDAERDWRDLSTRAAGDPAVDDRFRRACEAAREAITRTEQRSAEERRREAARLQSLAVRQQLCETVEALQGLETPEGLATALAAWRTLGPFDDPPGRDLGTRFAVAVERCEHRHERWQVRNAFRSQLEALVKDAERLVESADPGAAARPRAALEKRWAQVESSPAGTKWFADERALQRRFVEAGEAVKKQAESIRAERQQRERQARGQLKALCHHLEQLAQAGTTAAAADRGLAATADAAQHLRALPAAEREALRQRMTAARQTLTQRVDERATEEDWKRWANADVQQQLIERAEALLAANDPRQMLGEIGRLDQEWKRFAVAPRDQSQVLWNRFRRARDALRRRGEAYLAENLAQKEALCVAVEPLADSTEWSATAATIRRMQDEWKEIGPVRQQQSAALFERFRAPANRFFERHKQFRLARKAQRDELLSQMRTLCEAAEAVADSTDWDATAAEIKRLQLGASEVRGRRGRPVPRQREGPRQADVLRDRFQTACDRFFDRYRRRDDLELEAKLGAVATILADLESLRLALASPEGPTVEQVTQRLKDRLAEWGRIGPIPPDRARTLTQQLQAGCEAVEAACPNGLPDGAFDAESNVPQRQKLCIRLERLATSLATGTDEPSPSDLAERLKLALAANTIGGPATLPREQMRREAAEAAERLREKWQRLGPVIGNRARSLAQRFEKATVELADLTVNG